MTKPSFESIGSNFYKSLLPSPAFSLDIQYTRSILTEPVCLYTALNTQAGVNLRSLFSAADLQSIGKNMAGRICHAILYMY